MPYIRPSVRPACQRRLRRLLHDVQDDLLLERSFKPGRRDRSSRGRLLNDSQADETSADETSADETSADETSADKIPADKVLANETLADENALLVEDAVTRNETTHAAA